MTSRIIHIFQSIKIIFINKTRQHVNYAFFQNYKIPKDVYTSGTINQSKNIHIPT